MVKKLDPMLVEILSKYAIDGQEALWDCHGTLVMYHRFVEVVAAKAGVSFDTLQVLETDLKNGVAAVLCSGSLDGRVEWSTGECSPKNNKNSYPLAMAEKRAKDRVVLKLVGLHGFICSENEGEFEAPSKQPNAPSVVELGKREIPAELRRSKAWEKIVEDFASCTTLVQVEAFAGDFRKRAEHHQWTQAWKDSLEDRIEITKQALEEFPISEAAE